MSKPIIFDLKNKKVLRSSKLSLEKELQNIVELNMKDIFNLRFLESEYSFNDEEGNGRIDSLALDESNRPVVIEYKLNTNKNVINQCLYYMDWIMNHKGDFGLLVQDKLGKEARESIEWKPSGICIAESFNKYDNRAVKQMGADIQLFQYYCYGDTNQFIGFENVNRIINDVKGSFSSSQISLNENNNKKNYEYEQYETIYQNLNEKHKLLVDEIIQRVKDISDDVSVNILSRYASFKKINIFGSLVLQKNSVLLLLKLKYDKRMGQFDIVEDVKDKGHWGIGETRIRLNSIDQLDSIWHFVLEAYEKNN